MAEIDPKISELEARLDSLVRTQIDFQQEITTIRRELTKLRGAAGPPLITRPLEQPTAVPPQNVTPPSRRPAPNWTAAAPPPIFGTKPEASSGQSSAPHDTAFSRQTAAYKASAKSDLEKFIGENLISKIGIIVLVLGVGIGAKYAIDNGWVSPLMRVVFGYVMGFGLLGFSVGLKAKYLNFSSVLLSGGMAIMYFVTYFAYAYYSLMPQPAAFILMAMFTAFTVASAIFYNRQIIAHIGLVGAYAVPFLLSDNSGNYLFLFTYMAILNGGILAISIKKYWKPLFYTSFLFTWVIYYAWFVTKYSAGEHFYLALTFAAVFFVIFYATTMVHGATQKDGEKVENAIGLLLTSFVFYGFGYAILDSREDWRGFAGVFTVVNSGFHLLIAQAVSRFKPFAVSLVQVLTVLVVTFATISIPVQFDGNTITLIWTVEAAALFWYGRARLMRLFEYFSYPLMVLATGSMVVDWLRVYADRTFTASELNRQPLANGDFVTALVFVAAFAFIYVTNRDKHEDAAIGSTLVRPFAVAVAAIGLFFLYNALRIEIGNYFHLQMAGYESVYGLSSLVEPTLLRRVDDIARFNIIWQLNYTMFFLITICVINLRKVRSSILAFAGVGFSGFVLFIFVTAAMYLFYELRASYIEVYRPEQFIAGVMNIAIRYISYTFVAALLGSIFAYSRDELLTEKVPKGVLIVGFDAVLYSTVLITASCELVNLMVQFHIPDAEKLGLSILWGVYGLLLIALGIAWNKKHLRITAIVLLAVTLVKLFIYDVADLPTIPKTILFVSLGLLLLIVSFLYNKYRALIFKTGAEPAE